MRQPTRRSRCWITSQPHLICEIRNVSVAKGADPMGRFRGQNKGILIDCEGGATSRVMPPVERSTTAKEKDQGSRRREQPQGVGNSPSLQLPRRRSQPAVQRAGGRALVGHLSAACCHMANTSHRLGKQVSPEAIKSSISGNGELADAFDRCSEVLRKNGVDLEATPATLGPWVTLDAKEGRFVGEFADAANALARREYRKPFVVPEITKGDPSV